MSSVRELLTHASRYALLAVFGAVLLVGSLLLTSYPGLGGMAAVLGAVLTGYLISLVLFFRTDEDLRGLKTILIGAISGTTLAQSKEIVQRISFHFGKLSSVASDEVYRSRLFFFAVSGGLLGLASGYFATRFDLEPLLAKRDAALKALDQLPDTAALSSITLLGTDEMWPELEGKVPDVQTLDALAKKDWREHAPNDALRAAAAFFAAKRWKDVLNAVGPALRAAEPPSISGFDLYVGALSRDLREISGEPLHKVKAISSRLLAYWPDSFLVNLDLGYLYLYVPRSWQLAEHYTQRALTVRPDSGAASLNLACALAQKIRDTQLASDVDVERIIACLDVMFASYPDARAKYNAEGDFNVEPLQKHPKFAAWLQAKGS
jgi:tetratricopeptide (TPR) repeat protein